MSYRTKYLDQDNRRQPDTDFHCIACHKSMDKSKPHKSVHLVDGGPFVLHPDDENKYVSNSSDLGCFPIGNDCARKLGVQWTF